MPRRPKKYNFDSSEQPGLFDQPGATEPGTSAQGSPLPIHPSITAYAAKIRLAGGFAPSTENDPDSAAAVIEPISRRVAARPMMFMSFGSGSSGNCSYVGNGSAGFLIDAGVNPDHVVETLLHNGIDIDSVRGIYLTHDHSDHVHFAYTMLRAHRHMRLFCTPKTLNGILRRHNISRRIKDYHEPIYKEFTYEAGPFRITPFDVSHDGTDNSGFFIEYGDQRLAVATDLGCITDRVDFYMRQAQHIVIESNYDAEMLRNGPYPEYLRARITGFRGHLDNADTARFLAEIYTERLRNVFLCHLSHDNNLPSKALETVGGALLAAGVEAIGDGSRSLEAERAPVQLTALPRYDASPLYTLLHIGKSKGKS